MKFSFTLIVLVITCVLTEDCSNWNGLDACQGQQVDNPPTMATRRWQTPHSGDRDYKDSYQNMNVLVGYAVPIYSKDHHSATVKVYATHKNNETLQYSYNGGAPVSSDTFQVTISFTQILKIVVTAADGSKFQLPDIDFMWNAPAVNTSDNYEKGQKGAIIELFGWPYGDIAKECEAIGKMGYLGVKVYPPNEHVFTYEWPQNNYLNPWWFLYQPVSYKLDSRHGTRAELRDMIYKCRSNNVRVYADAVVNHMAGNGNDIINHRQGSGGSCVYWGGKDTSSSSPSAYFTHGFAYQNNTYTGQHPALEFPGVPYGPLDFHCERPLNDWSSGFSLNYGWLSGLTDLNTEHSYVQRRIADYFTDLISIGFSGFRIDAAKHISPDDLAVILGIFKKNMGDVLPDDWFAFLEVLIGGEKDLLSCNNNPYQYTTYFTNALKSQGYSDNDILKVKIWSSDYPKEFPICGYWIIPSERYVVQNDCHDDQQPGSSSRDMGDKGSVLVIQKNVDVHRGFEVQLFKRTDGNWKIRMVLSSYTLFKDTKLVPDGFPDGKSDCSKCVGPNCEYCRSVPYTPAYDPNVCGYTVEEFTPHKYTRVHRDKSIIMAMRSWMELPTNVPNSAIGLPDQCQ